MFIVITLCVALAVAGTVQSGPYYPFEMCSIEPSPQFVVTLITDVWGAGAIAKHPVFKSSINCTLLPDQCVVFAANTTSIERTLGNPVLTPFYTCSGVIPEVDCTPMKMVGVQLNISVLTVKATFDSDISWNYTSIGKSKRCPDPDGDGYFLPTSMRGKTKGDYTWYWEDDDNFSATLWYDGTSGQTWPLDLYSLDYDSKTKRKGTQRNDDGFVYCITCY